MSSPRELARACDLALAARWRGEDAAAGVFEEWLEAHWWPGGPAEPAEAPDAISVLGGAGAGIRWYARGSIRLGYVRGRRGCFCIPARAAPPVIPLMGGEFPGRDDPARRRLVSTETEPAHAGRTAATLATAHGSILLGGEVTGDPGGADWEHEEARDDRRTCARNKEIQPGRPFRPHVTMECGDPGFEGGGT
jgi:hypothetical protein